MPRARAWSPAHQRSRWGHISATHSRSMASTRSTSSVRSLRARLPMLMLALVSVVLVIFMAVAYRLLEMTLVDGGTARAQAAATQIADMMRQSTQQRIAEAQRIA